MDVSVSAVLFDVVHMCYVYRVRIYCSDAAEPEEGGHTYRMTKHMYVYVTCVCVRLYIKHL